MNLGELVAEARDRCGDRVEPYLVTTSDLKSFANQAEHEACHRAHLIIDRTNGTYCRIELTPYNPVYSLNEKVLLVKNAYVGPSMRATTLSWDAATRQLRDSANGFLLAGFRANDVVTVFGFTTAANNGVFSVGTAEAGALTMVEETMVDEAAGDTVTVRANQLPVVERTRVQLDALSDSWETQTGDLPEIFVQEENNELLVVPIPVYANTLSLVVSRLPAADMAADGASPEIPVKYHADLVPWMLHKVYSSNTHLRDSEKAEAYRKEFERIFGARPSARAARVMRQNSMQTFVRPREFGF